MNASEILGRQVLPLPIKKGMISGQEADRVNADMGAWLRGDKAREHYARAVERAECEYDEDSVRMEWYVFAVCADKTVTLRSELGYTRVGVNLDEFEVIKDGKTW